MAGKGRIPTTCAAQRPQAARRALLALAALLLAALALAWAPCADAAQAGLKASSSAETSPSSVNVKAAAAAANAKGRANSAVVFRYGLVNLKSYREQASSTERYDVTGDARPDEVAVSVEPRGEAGLFDSLAVTVNGKSAYVAKAPKAGFDQAVVRILTLRNNQPFLYVGAYAADGSASQVLLQYRSGAFSKVVGNDLLQREGASDAHITSIRPSANRIIVQFDFTSTITGLSRTSFAYVWKGSGLVRKSDATAALRYATKVAGGYTKQARKAARAFAAYADSSLKKKAFGVSAGQSVRPLGIRLVSGGLAYKLRVGKKVGWAKCPSAAQANGSPLLSGTYGRVPQIIEAPEYTTKALGASTLQRYGNHALFIARNEVYARHGLIYSTDELKAHFQEQGWYTPSSSAVTLSKAELKNVVLMRSIEQKRKSPYV